MLQAYQQGKLPLLSGSGKKAFNNLFRTVGHDLKNTAVVGRPLYDRTGDNNLLILVSVVLVWFPIYVGATKVYMGSVQVGPK